MNSFLYALGILLCYFTLQHGGPNIFVLARNSAEDDRLELYREVIQVNCEDLLNGTSRTDFLIRLTDQFRKWDKNKDSYITVDEFIGWENDHGLVMNANLAEAWFIQYDVDTNGQLRVDEFATTRLDLNDDSTLTMDECLQYNVEKFQAALNYLRNMQPTTE